MFAKVDGEAVVEWPIPSITALFPNTSFPSPLTDKDLPSGYVAVAVDPTPFCGPAQKTVAARPVQRNGKWVQGWTVVDLASAEMADRISTVADDVRAERNRRLAACDWTQLSDAHANKDAWAAYRQALRDVTAQPGFPMNVSWPLEPAA